MATDQGEHPELPPLRPTDANEQQLGRRTRRSFITGAIAAAAGYGSWRWLRSREPADGVAWPIRRVLDANGRLARAMFPPQRNGESHPANTAPMNPRVNEDIGLSGPLNLDQWRLNVTGLAAGNGSLQLKLEDIKALPKVETAMRLCCIEGWSTLVNWGGARFADFVAKYPPLAPSGQPVDVKNRPHDLFQYVSLSTPDGEYYVALDAASAIHPQTLLCYEIDGQPLSLDHGAPLRLVIPSKYGIKNLKRIGTIAFTAERPADYWAQRGYDWHAGL